MDVTGQDPLGPDDDAPLDAALLDAARAYHAPPPLPADAMWTRIEAARRAAPPAPERSPVVVPIHSRRWLHWGAGIAATLAVGIGIGRLLPRGGDAAPAAVAAARGTSPEAAPDLAYDIAAQQYLGTTEAFLTAFRASARRADRYEAAPATARRLLAQNRLLLDSPAAHDARVRALLEELELVLASIAQLEPERDARLEHDLIIEGLDGRDVLPRLRAAVPAGYTPVRNGAL